MTRTTDIRDGERGDAGFSLAELMVAMSLGLVILGVVYFIFESSLTSYRLVDETSQATRAASYAMHQMTRYVRETQAIEPQTGGWQGGAGDYTLRYRADRDDDGEFEQVYYYLDAENRLIEQVDEFPLGTSTEARVLATGVRNAEVSNPLFRYYRMITATGTVECTAGPSGMDGGRLTGTKVVRITLVVDVDPSKRPEPFSARSDVYLRNPLY